MDTIEKKLRALGAEITGSFPENCCRISDNTQRLFGGEAFLVREGASALSEERVQALVAEAIEKKASAIICDPKWTLEVQVPVIHLKDPHTRLKELAQAFYGNPSTQHKIIAVTGTNGKTTCCHIIESLLKLLGYRVGVIGTISHRYPGFSEKSVNTTPGILQLYDLLTAMINTVDFVVMEVSSHGLALDRVWGLHFDVAIWTNLGQDHLDFHKNMADYALAKKKLFTQYLPASFRAGKKPCAIYNANDPQVTRMVKEALKEADWGGLCMSFGDEFSPRTTDLRAVDVSWDKTGWVGLADFRRDPFPLIWRHAGKFNIPNALAAALALIALGFRLIPLFRALEHVAATPGRLELIEQKAYPKVYIDFAHTPEALEKAILAIREIPTYKGKLWLVFGAGGDRDASKRPRMGRIASKLVDYAIITSDNPRNEDPMKIIADIESGFAADSNAKKHILISRKEAIHYALSLAKTEDCVLIAGKGHEEYQIIGDEKIYCDDRETVLMFMEDESSPPPLGII
ncbi:MAG: UDP-N-acetylmuramoyl-L-alanyl-D-glutamate--2,6-diaminopimelate ligase [Bradymonadales bacterium]|jgi:UDP-N-acetylmuramoyl-L-alanyl-D-glutamate--2,6-diaminopimelate ligase